ncbi:hypothetical protein BDR22DRAFT_827821 [Usnea florida]
MPLAYDYHSIPPKLATPKNIHAIETNTARTHLPPRPRKKKAQATLPVRPYETPRGYFLPQPQIPKDMVQQLFCFQIPYTSTNPSYPRRANEEAGPR